MAEEKKLGPMDAAQLILEDILSHPDKKNILQHIPQSADDFYFGNRILNEV